MDDVDAAIVRIDGADDEKVEPHQEVRKAEVDDEEGGRLRSVGADSPDDDEQVTNEGRCAEDPDAHLGCGVTQQSRNQMPRDQFCDPRFTGESPGQVILVCLSLCLFVHARKCITPDDLIVFTQEGVFALFTNVPE